MRLVGNILWFILGGWALALSWLLSGLVFAITIVGLPFTRSAWEIAKMSAFPFGKEVVHVNDINDPDAEKFTVKGILGFLLNVIWLLVFGIQLFIGHVVFGLIACVFIITIPFGIASFKLAAISLWPVGRRVVTSDVANVVGTMKAEKYLANKNDRKLPPLTKE